jgi:hypothetical protein
MIGEGLSIIFEPSHLKKKPTSRKFKLSCLQVEEKLTGAKTAPPKLWVSFRVPTCFRPISDQNQNRDGNLVSGQYFPAHLQNAVSFSKNTARLLVIIYQLSVCFCLAKQVNSECLSDMHLSIGSCTGDDEEGKTPKPYSLERTNLDGRSQSQQVFFR